MTGQTRNDNPSTSRGDKPPTTLPSVCTGALAAPTMLNRCAQVNLAALWLDMDGRVLDARPGPLEALPSMRAVREAAGAWWLRIRREGADPVVCELLDGLHIAPMPISSDMATVGVVVALLPGSGLTKAGWFIEGLRERGVGENVAHETLRESPKFDRAGAGLLARVLGGIVQDVRDIEETRSSLSGFTTQLAESYDTIDLLYSIGRSIRAPYEAAEFIRSVCERLQKTMCFRWVAARLFDNSSLLPEVRDAMFHFGVMPGTLIEMAVVTERLSMPDQLDGSGVVTNLEPLTGRDSRQAVVQPLTCRGRMVGVLAAGGKYGVDPDVSSYDIQLLEAAAGFINSYLDNVALFEEQRSLFIGTVQALTAAIDAKDRYTRGHSERVAHLSAAIARTAGKTPAECERVRIAGLVHDVGKIGVPEAVLTKPGRLTDEEFNHIKKHPEIGYRILRDIPQLGDVLPGVLYHHERLDGKGYPHNLEGEQIPEIARIIAVADTFDAMSSDRAYRRAKSREEVLREVERVSGSQLDMTFATILRNLDLTEYDRLVAMHAAGLVSKGGDVSGLAA